MRPELAVCPHRQQRGGQHREGHQDHDRGDQDGPGEQGHPEHRHAGSAQTDDRGDEVDCTQDRAETSQRETEDPQVTAQAGAVGHIRKWSVGEPAEGRRTLGCQEPGARDQTAEKVRPVGEHVEPWERHIWRADLDRHEGVGESGEQRSREQQQHDRAVHGEQLVVLLGADHDLQAWGPQFGPDQQREQPTDHEEGERGDEVKVADHLVVGRRDPPDHGLTGRPTTCCRGGPQGHARVQAGHHLLPSVGRRCWSPGSIFSRLRPLSSKPRLPNALSSARCAS